RLYHDSMDEDVQFVCDEVLSTCAALLDEEHSVKDQDPVQKEECAEPDLVKDLK
ncbi:hypothetical protein BGZ52_009825, partial [Haplosporangium bisporale]